MARIDRSHHAPRLALGIAAILVGALLTLRNLDVPGIDEALRLWPLLVIAIGLSMALRPRGASSRGVGLFLIVVGGWYQLRSFHLVRGDIFDLWPLLLVYAGGAMIWQVGRGRRNPDPDDPGRRGETAELDRARRGDHGRGGDRELR